jgi:hypothetical protein
MRLDETKVAGNECGDSFDRRRGGELRAVSNAVGGPAMWPFRRHELEAIADPQLQDRDDHSPDPRRGRGNEKLH